MKKEYKQPSLNKVEFVAESAVMEVSPYSNLGKGGDEDKTIFG